MQPWLMKGICKLVSRKTTICSKANKGQKGKGKGKFHGSIESCEQLIDKQYSKTDTLQGTILSQMCMKQKLICCRHCPSLYQYLCGEAKLEVIKCLKSPS